MESSIRRSAFVSEAEQLKTSTDSSESSSLKSVLENPLAIISLRTSSLADVLLSQVQIYRFGWKICASEPLVV